MTRARGFTLIEIVLAMVILGAMMLLLWQGLAFSLRSWDAADAVGAAWSMDPAVAADAVSEFLTFSVSTDAANYGAELGSPALAGSIRT